MENVFYRSIPVGISCAMGLLLLAGCVTAPPQPMPVMQAPALPQVDVAAYPRNGQSDYQQRRDRFECHNWAVAQSGFDPGRMNMNEVAPPASVRVEPNPPVGTDTAALGITGAIIGAAVSNPRNAGGGALAGLAIGGLLGAASDSARQAAAQRTEDAMNNRGNMQLSQLNQRADSYRRALGACLEGRGYTVR
ncbi:MAG: glycine zipper family protein [Betaproteobacteria bacterium]|nr:glycine zipper family protein [Betaproteobacteria bacterium]